MLSDAKGGRNNRNNQNNKPQSVNSTIVQFYNSELEQDSSTLLINGWDALVSIRIVLPQEDNGRNNYMQFDYQGARSFAISQEQLQLIKHGILEIEESLSVKDKKDKMYCFAIQGGVNNNKFLKIGYNRGKLAYEGYEGMYYCAIIEMDENNRKEVDKVIHFFKGTKIETNNNTMYNSFNEDDVKNSMKNKVVTNADWLAFKEIIISLADNGINSGIHGSNIIVAYKFATLNNQINIIKGMIEAQFGRRDNSNSGGYSRQNRSYSRGNGGRGYSEDTEEDNPPQSKKSRKEKKAKNLDELEEDLD